MGFGVTFTGTDVAAWWGAIVATSVLAWDVYKWKSSGARLRVKVQSGMKLLDDPAREHETLITVKVTNIGDRPTTITTIGLRHYSSWWNKIRKKPSQSCIIPRPSLNHQVLPYVLEVGQEWIGGVTQTPEFEAMARNGYLIAEAYDSVHEKPSVGRVVVERKAS